MRKDSQLTRKFKVYLWLFFARLKFSICPLCKDKSSPALVLCEQCLVSLPKLGRCCEKCKEPLPEDDSLLCRRCLKHKRLFDDCIIPFVYQSPVSEMLQKLKYNGKLIYIRPMVNMLIEELEEHYSETSWPEVIIPVPLHYWRLRKRGFNQAGLIASRISKVTGIPVLQKLIKRKKTDSQKGLSITQRQKNIKSAFTLNHTLKQNHVAIIDDVMTTGATVEELCRTLKKGGAITVDIWCLARTPFYK